jgi:hypothetical protein
LVPDAGFTHDAAPVQADAPVIPPDAPAVPDAFVPDAPPDAPPPPPALLGAPVTIDAGELVWSAHLADLDGDGRRDLVYLTRDHVAIRRGLANGTFAAPVAGPATTSWWLAAGDIDGDGIADLAATGCELVTVWFGNGDGTFGVPHSAPLYDGPVGITVADADGYPGDEIAPPRQLAEAVLVEMDEVGRREHELGPALVERDLLLELRRPPAIVGIDERDQLAARDHAADVARAAGAGVRLANHDEVVGARRCDANRRAVVDDDDLVVAERLRADRIERLVDPVGLLRVTAIRRDHHAHLGLRTHVRAALHLEITDVRSEHVGGQTSRMPRRSGRSICYRDSRNLRRHRS